MEENINIRNLNVWLKLTEAGYIYISFTTSDKEPLRTYKKAWSSESILYNQNNSTYHPNVIQMVNLLQIKYVDDYKAFLAQISKLIQSGYLNHKKVYHYGNKAEEAVFVQKLFNAYYCQNLFPYFSLNETTNQNASKIITEVKNNDMMMLLL